MPNYQQNLLIFSSLNFAATIIPAMIKNVNFDFFLKIEKVKVIVIAIFIMIANCFIIEYCWH